MSLLVLLGGSSADTADAADAKSLFEQMSENLSSGNWFSTQETSNALRSAMLYMQGGQSSSQTKEIKTEYSFGAGSGRNSHSFTSQTSQISMGNPSGVSGVFTVRNVSDAPVYARVSVRGLPEEGKEQPLSNGLSLAVEYRDESGNVINPAYLNPGRDMVINVTVANNRPVKIENIALVHQLPASWEIINDRIGAEGKNTSSFDYQDIRDDRVMTYFSLNAGAAKTVAVRVNNTYGGSYFRPAIHAYVMYDESLAALIPGVR